MKKKGIKQSKEEYEKKCGASWQVSCEGGVLYKIKCRYCGAMVQSGGTPRCLNK